MALPNRIRDSIQNQAQRVLQTGQRFKRFDQIRQRHFWSTYRFTPDANGYISSGEFDIFQTPAGQAGQGFTRQLTLLETNWPSANRVPDNQNFEITELGVTGMVTGVPGVDGDNGEEQTSYYPGLENEVMRNMVLAITYLTNTVPLGFCTDFAQASGPRVGFYAPNIPAAYSGVADASPAISNFAPVDIDYRRTFVTNGFAAPGLRRRFKIPILLQHGETFRFTFIIPAGRGPYVIPPEVLGDVAPVIDVRLDFWATESFVENS